jgi:hypothetical protein
LISYYILFLLELRSASTYRKCAETEQTFLPLLSDAMLDFGVFLAVLNMIASFSSVVSLIDELIIDFNAFGVGLVLALVIQDSTHPDTNLK